MLVLLLIIFSLFTSPVFAVPNTQITVAPTSLSSIGITFPVQFIITNADANTSFYYKFYGGIGSSTSQIQTSSSLSYTSDWTSFNTVTTDAGGSAVVNSSAYLKSDVLSGSYNLYTRLALTPKTGDSWITYNSAANTITVTAPSPTATPIPTATLTPTATPTPDPAVINPSSGISLTEFMPYSSIEWLELYNSNDYDVKLVAWKIEDNSANTRNISELRIKAKSYAIFEFSAFLNNSDSDKLILYNQDQKIIDSYQYPSGKFDLEKSWSKNDKGWCQTLLSKGQSNYQCYITPTSTLTPTPIPTDNPIEETPSIEPTSIISDSQKVNTDQNTSTNSALNLEDSSISMKRNFLPIVLIFGGALLLLSPVIISKIKK